MTSLFGLNMMSIKKESGVVKTGYDRLKVKREISLIP